MLGLYIYLLITLKAAQVLKKKLKEVFSFQMHIPQVEI